MGVRRGYVFLYYALVGAVVLALLLAPAPGLAKKEAGKAQHNPAGPAPRTGGGNPQPRPQEHPLQQHPQRGGVFQRLRELSPEQQQHFMANNPQFQRLSPERQELIREHLRQWNAMTPAEQERVRQREEILQALSPAQRQEAREIFPQWRNLTPPRRQALMVAFRHLRDLPPDQRQAYLNSQGVSEQFSPHERDILGGMNRLLSNGPVRPSQPPEPPDE